MPHLSLKLGLLLLLLLDEEHLILLMIENLLAVLSICRDYLMLLMGLHLWFSHLTRYAHTQHLHKERLKVWVGLELIPNEGLLLSGLQGGQDLMELIGYLVMQVMLFFD